MSRRASLLTKDKKRPKVRFPDELVFLDNVKENDIQGMASMLRRVSVQIDVNAIAASGMTPLHSAVVEGNVAAVKLLVRHGADINKKDADTWTPLHAACANGHGDILKFLLENGADKNIRNEDGERPYDLIEPDDFECVSIMLSHNRDDTTTTEAMTESEDDEEDDEEDLRQSSLALRTMRHSPPPRRKISHDIDEPQASDSGEESENNKLPTILESQSSLIENEQRTTGLECAGSRDIKTESNRNAVVRGDIE